MMTLAYARDAFSRHGASFLDYTMRDVSSAMEMTRKFEDQGMSYDRKRASEYADELHILVQVRRENTPMKCCKACGRPTL